MESRAAIRLGENIKLLTFVSVFFLPLSCCTVGPSIPNAPLGGIDILTVKYGVHRKGLQTRES